MAKLTSRPITGTLQPLVSKPETAREILFSQSLFWSPNYEIVEYQDVNGDGNSNGDGKFSYTYSLWVRVRYWRGSASHN